MHERFSRKGVAFRLVYVDPGQPVESVKAHIREYAYPFGALLDPRHEFVMAAGVRITPEVAVFSSGRLVYRGRIDNRFVSLGTTRPRATMRDLEDVLERITSGRQVAFRETKAVGCFIDDLK
jgi:hypothetical protein